MTEKSRTLSANTISGPVKAISATAVSVTGLAWSYHLLASGLVNQLSFISLVAIWILVFLFISFSHRIKTLSFRQLSIELERIEETRKEVEARERRVSAIAHIQSEITEKIISRHGLLLGGDVAEADKQWLIQKNSELKALTENELMI